MNKTSLGIFLLLISFVIPALAENKPASPPVKTYKTALEDLQADKKEKQDQLAQLLKQIDQLNAQLLNMKQAGLQLDGQLKYIEGLIAKATAPADQDKEKAGITPPKK